MKLKIKNCLSLPIIMLFAVVGCTSSDINNNIPVNSNDLVDTNVIYKSETVKVEVENAPVHSLDKNIEEHNKENKGDNTVKIIIAEKEEEKIESVNEILSTENLNEEEIAVITPPPAKEDETVSFVKSSYEDENFYEPVTRFESDFDKAVREAEEKRGIKPEPKPMAVRPSQQRRFSNINNVNTPKKETVRKFDIKEVEPLKNITFLSAIIYHSNGKADISSADMKAIKSVANFVNKNNATVRIIGNSSSRSKNMKEIENKLTNFDLSILRAEKVRDALIKNGISADKIFIDGVADTEKVVEENMPINEAINRRTEIYINY
ncbi:MAG: OmpA family protein [Alphaproteobacteria bacterium]